MITYINDNEPPTTKAVSWKALILVLGILFTSGITQTNAQDASFYLKKMDDIIFAPKDKTADVSIVTYKNDKEDKVREATLLQLGADKKIYKYTKPESQAGIATLSLPDDIMWMKMPAFDKPKKISLLAKSAAFNGTDFSLEDIPNQPYAERYDVKLLGEEGTNVKLELTPKSNKSNYSKLVVQIDKTHYYPVTMEYYDKGGNLEKVASYVYSKVGKYWNANEVTMTNLKKKTATKISMTNIKFDQGLPESEFTEENFWK